MKTCKRGHSYEVGKVCPICKAENQRNWKAANKVQEAENNRKWKAANKDQQAENNRKWVVENKDRHAETMRKWQAANRVEQAENQRLYRAKRKASDPLFKLKCNISSLIFASFKNQGWNKSSKSQAILGCNFATLQAHLIDSAIRNYGSYDSTQPYHIDHVIPVGSAINEAQLIQLNHYSNLQYLYPEHNLAKKDQLDWVIPAS